MTGGDGSTRLVYIRSSDDGEVITYCYKDSQRPAETLKVKLTCEAKEVLLTRLDQDHRRAADDLGVSLLPLAAPDPGITITSVEARDLDLGPTFRALPRRPGRG